MLLRIGIAIGCFIVGLALQAMIVAAFASAFLPTIKTIQTAFEQISAVLSP